MMYRHFTHGFESESTSKKNNKDKSKNVLEEISGAHSDCVSVVCFCVLRHQRVW